MKIFFVILALVFVSPSVFSNTNREISILDHIKDMSLATCHQAVALQYELSTPYAFSEKNGSLLLAASNASGAMCTLLKTFVLFKEGKAVDVSTTCKVAYDATKELHLQIRDSSGVDPQTLGTATYLDSDFSRGTRALCLSSIAPGFAQKTYWKYFISD